MRVVTTLEEWRDWARAQRAAGRTVGLVPTMGALHDGHVALVDAARARGDAVLLTIFVNPRQFNSGADLARYPRTPEHDEAVARAAGVELLVRPSVEAMWPDSPEGTLTTVHVRELADPFEGAGRPGHFDGVASVVAKLFAVTGPCRAYFGEKDFQQLRVVTRMARDLGFDVEVVPCPTVREASGLALSSRNALLSESGRTRANALARAVASVAEVDSVARARTRLRDELAASDLDIVYAEIVDATDLTPALATSRSLRALVCATVEGVRLIDNGPVVVKGD